ncbi:MAG: succinate dehydrogenase cytochrome b subunit [Prolixibacteraceae bacterium]|nr:succinate dehydrogenase cytochrome b subunit [Prolixibacteraceae bacterium]
MSKFLEASIGRKFLMSITGLFLVSFIAVHLAINLLLIFDDTGELFNKGAYFMATNPAIKIMEPLLGLGFIIHIVWSFFLEYKNWKARPIKYNKKSVGDSSSWASRNMLILGTLVLVFLVMHIIDFFWVIRFDPHTMQSVTIGGVEMEDTYTLVADLFKGSIIYSIFYIIGALLLGFHLSHGFWSAFHTLGLNNKYWMKRWQVIGYIYAIIVTVGFIVIPLYFLIKF